MNSEARQDENRRTPKSAAPPRRGGITAFASPLSAFGVAVALCGSVSLFSATRAFAGPAGLDDATFIAGLEERGMSELILHLLEIDPPDDPVVQELIAIAQQRLRYRDPGLSRAERQEAFRLAVEGLESLIDRHTDHPQRPIWLTDLASMRLIDDLRTNRRLAATAVRFGVPTDEQRHAFQRLSPAALEATQAAQRGLFELRGDLARDDQRRETLENDGTYRRLFRDYGELRTPYYHAMASLYVASLDDTPDTERRDLIRQGVETAEPLRDPSKQIPSIAAGATAMLGQFAMLEGDAAEAVGLLEQARSIGAEGVDELVATLALARALAASDRLSRAGSLLEALATQDDVRRVPTYRLLVADAHHRLLREQAQSADAIAASYEPYFDLLQDPSLSEGARRTLRSFVHRRWATTAPTVEAARRLPPIVRLGIGEHWLNEARRARSANDAARAEALFELANALHRTLRDASLPARVRAPGLYRLGLGLYFLSNNDPAAAAEAARLMTEAADDHPDQPVSARAIANAVSITRPAATSGDAPEAARSAYVAAAEVLLRKYDATEAADAERLTYATAVLQPRGEHERAAEVLDGVPRDHANYFDAQAARLRSLTERMRQASTDAALEERRDLAAAEADRVAAAARSASSLAPGTGAMRAWAEARFTLAAVALSRGEPDAALRQLEGFEDDFADDAALLRRGYQEMIAARVEADQLERAVTLAEAMTREFPEASAFVIDRVVTRLDEEISTLRDRAAAAAARSVRQELEGQAQDRAEAAARLTALLLQWAQRRGYAGEQLLPYQVLHGETLRLAGRADDALELLDPLVQRYPTDASVLFQHGEALFALGMERSDPQLLSRALRAFGPLSRSNLYPRPLPDMFWVSNLRIIQVMDAREDDSTDILLRIRRLEQIDDNLGGNALQRDFNTLRAKHS